MKPILLEITVGNCMPLNSFVSEHDTFRIQITLSIGIEKELGEEQFYFTVCNYESYEAEVLFQEESYRWHHKHELLLKRYDPKVIKFAVENLLNSIDKPTWKQIVSELRRYFKWEYD